MKKNIIVFAPVIILALLTGCEKVSFQAASGKKIGVNVSIKDNPQTKGKEIISDNLGSEYGAFVMDCWVDEDYIIYSGTYGTEANTITERHYFDEVDVTYDSSTGWSLDTDQYWLNRVDMTFWSWAPKGAASLVVNNDSLSGEDEISFTYTSPATVKSQKDVLFAYSFSPGSQHSDGGSNNSLDITFHHALAQIRFSVSPDDGTFKIGSTDGYEIVSIALSGVPSYGECTFDGPEANGATSAPCGFTWSDQANPASFTSSCGNYTTTAEWNKDSYTSGSDTYDLYTTKEVFFVIPNSAAGKTADITFKRKSDGTFITKQVALKDKVTEDPDEWKAGYYYNYKIKATDINSDLSLDLTVSPWDVVDEDVRYHTIVAKSGAQLTFEDGKYIPAADPTTREVTIKNGQPVPASFELEAPIGGEIIITLSGYIGAFKVDNIVNDTIESPSKTTTFKIVPLISDPKMDYKVQVHVYVKFKDGKVVNADDVIQAGGVPHTVILPAI